LSFRPPSGRAFGSGRSASPASGNAGQSCGRARHIGAAHVASLRGVRDYSPFPILSPVAAPSTHGADNGLCRRDADVLIRFGFVDISRAALFAKTGSLDGIALAHRAAAGVVRKGAI